MDAKIVYKSFATNPEYFVLCEKGVLRVVQDETESDYEIGEFVELKGARKGGALYATDVELAPEEREEELEKKASAWGARLARVQEPTLLVQSPTLKAMVPVFKEAALFLQEKLIEMTPLWVRFDEDADGITSALYFKSIVDETVKRAKLPYPASFFNAFQSEAPIFEGKHFRHLVDGSDHYAKKPLLLLLDHGGNEESAFSLKKARDAGYEILLVDHHPPNRQALSYCSLVVHPLLHDGNSSVVSGLLSYEIASSVFAASPAWARFALQGDKSAYAKGFYKEPTVLDYVSQEKPPLKEYEALLRNPARIDFLYAKCVAIRSAALKEAIARKIEESINGARVFWLDLSFHKKKYPPKGGVTQGLHEAFEKEGPLITVGFDSERVIFRANASAEEKGFKANELIEFLKKKMPIASGGGHPRAASMRLKPKTLDRAKEEIAACLERVLR